MSLVSLNNRHYDPSTGVFPSVDPLVTKTGQPYIYGAANPATFSDPSGLCIEPGTLSFNDDGSYSYVPMGGPECSDWDNTDRTDSPEPPAVRESYGVKSDVKRVEHGRGGAFTGITGWTVGITTGICIFICLEAGVSSDGPYARPGIGLALDSPGLVVDNEAPECGSDSTYAYVAGGVGPAQATLGGVSPGETSEWNTYSAVGIAPTTYGSAARVKLVSIGGGVKHEWTTC